MHHEQKNKEVKEEGGAISLTESPAELQKGMLAGPEMVRLVSEMETSMENKKPLFRNNEEAPGVQKRFSKHVNDLVKIFEDFGNPFLEQSNELLTIDTKDVMDSKVVTSIYTAKELGAKQYKVYISGGFLLTGRQSQILSQGTISHCFAVLSIERWGPGAVI